MSPAELDALLEVAQRRGVTRLRLADIEVEMVAHEAAFAPRQAQGDEPQPQPEPLTIEEKAKRLSDSLFVEGVQ